MSIIHQIYCTHCTHGSSALERREGELAPRMLGYSARAGSMEAGELRRYYRQIERYANYYLPRDTPGEEKLRLVAATAPRRLVFMPSTGGLQLTAQVCYRQTDTEGRPGSYFAHVLFQEENAVKTRWSPLDALRLWNAPGWVSEDSPRIPFFLSSLDSLEAMHGGQRPVVDDRVLWSFLTTPTDGAMDDPANVIPRRWRQMTPQQRCGLFVETFRGLLAINAGRHESLVVVVEPSVAALVFYGIVRMLPPPVREAISVSTYEPNAERVGTTLAATVFHDPQKSDLRPEAYRGRGFALNTFLQRRTENRSQGPYAYNIVQRLLQEGWPSVDRTLEDLAGAGVRRIEELDGLVAVERLVPVLFDPSQRLPSEEWRSVPTAFSYLRRTLLRRLGESSSVENHLALLVGQPSHLLLLELLLTGDRVPGSQDAVRYLLRALPAEKIGGFVELEGVSREAKEEVLAQYVLSRAQLPPGCDLVWQEPLSARGPRPAPHGHEPLLPRLLSRLDLPVLVQFYRNVSPRHSDEFVAALFHAYRENRVAHTAVAEVVGLMSDEALLSLFHSQGPGFFREYPREELALGRRLHAVLHTLPLHLDQFRARLDLLLAAVALLPTEEDHAIVEAWATCRQAILEIGHLQDQRRGFLRQRPISPLEAACQRMAEAIARALPQEAFEDNLKGSIKQECLHRIGSQLLGGKRLLPRGPWQYEALWQKIAWRFENGSWPNVPLEKFRRTRRRNIGWIALASIGAMLVFAILLALVDHLQKPPQPHETPSLKKPAEERPPEPRVEEVAGSGASVPAAREEMEEPLVPESTPQEEEERWKPVPPKEPLESGLAVPTTGEPLPKPAPSPTPITIPVDIEPALPRRLPVIKADLMEERRLALSLKPEAMAEVKPIVIGSPDRLLPAEVSKNYSVGCLVVTEGKDGFVERTEIGDISISRTHDVFHGSTKVRIQFRFFLRSNDPFAAEQEAVAESAWHVIQPVENGKQYIVRCELGKDGQAMLRELRKAK